MLKEHFLNFKRQVFPQLFPKTSQNSPENNLHLKVIEAIDLAAWILLGKPWKYLWVMISPLPFKSIYFSTIQHIGDTNLWNHHSFHTAVFFLLENFRYLAEFFFKCQTMSVFWVFCLSNFKILRKLHTILHQVPVGHQRYRRMLQILYFHIFIAKFG